MFKYLLLLKGFQASWLLIPLTFLLLFMDGIVYTLVAVAYKVFQLMSQLNVNTIGSLFISLTKRINAIIAVLILFIIGYSLIEYLINPDKALDKSKGGVAMLKNIAIAALLLGSYSFIFGVINEFSLLIVGTPNTYHYRYLKNLGVEKSEDDEGVIMRFITGGTSSLDDETENIDYGKKLAVTTLSSFLHGMESHGLYSRSERYDKSVIGDIFNQALKEDDFNIIFSLPSAASSIWVDVYYFPLLSTALGAYIIYMLITVSIQLGIRMFKLLVLQLIAPVAIITIMKDGFDSKIWKHYISVLGKTYTDAFIRIGAMYFSFSFITLAYNNLGRIFESAPEISDLSTLLVYGVIVVAVLKLGKEIPSMIDTIFESKLAENNKTGLSQFLGAAGGYALGSISGGISGAATRFRNAKNSGDSLGKSIGKGVLGGISGSVTGGIAGGAGGFKAKGGNIVEAIKNGSTEGWRAGAPGIGGYIEGAAEALGVGSGKINVERQVLNNLKESKQHAVNKNKNSDKTFFTSTSGKQFHVDITGDKGSALSKIKSSEGYRQLQQELANINAETVDPSDAAAVRDRDQRIRDKTAELNSIFPMAQAQYDYALGDVLSNDEDYKRDVKAMQRYYNKSESEFYSKSKDTIDQIENDIVYKEQLKQRKGKSAGGK